jgi:hypothetical protein
VFLRLLTGDGIAGLGGASRVSFEPRVIEDVFEEFVLGLDPFDMENLSQSLYGAPNAEHPGLTHNRVSVEWLAAATGECIIQKLMRQVCPFWHAPGRADLLPDSQLSDGIGPIIVTSVKRARRFLEASARLI